MHVARVLHKKNLVINEEYAEISELLMGKHQEDIGYLIYENLESGYL